MGKEDIRSVKSMDAAAYLNPAYYSAPAHISPTSLSIILHRTISSPSFRSWKGIIDVSFDLENAALRSLRISSLFRSGMSSISEIAARICSEILLALSLSS